MGYMKRLPVFAEWWVLSEYNSFDHFPKANAVVVLDLLAD